ncbi:hypothetical protein JR316_0002483 [Psilocybe cubensis]|uniref:Uncharacterized protein n=1 Tax=Psilocybe cubensis TaxID=181762 RepID=A0ACB8HCB9_PSICU|nr:hypothetical protein JR316_0002483 [Psilocybe cubensis]KAH9485573.1 hypothetical protein JR316_0002483 [Psilocybe cubensis]
MSPCPNYLTTRKVIAKSLASLSGSSASSYLSRGSVRLASSSTSAVSDSAKSEKDAQHAIPEPLTLLHKTRSLLPRIVGKGGPGFQQMAEVSHTLESVLSKAYQNGSCVSTPSLFNLSSGYLAQFPIPVEISELRSPSLPLTSSFSKVHETLRDILRSPTFLESDIRIIVCNPVTMPINAILEEHLPSKTILVLSSNFQKKELEAVVHQQMSRHNTHSLHPRTQSRDFHIISADPGRAIRAIRILQANPTSPSAIQKYSTDFVESQLSQVTKSLHDKLVPTKSMKTVQRKLGLERVQDVLHWFSVAILRTRNELDNAFLDQTSLKETLEEHRARIEVDIFQGRGQSDEKTPINIVSEAIKQAERDMRPVMDRLTWWQMIWRVDEISNIVATAVERTWCSNLEKKLILETGHLAALQNETSESALSLLSSHPTVATAVLKNTLLQIKRSPGYYLTPESLTQPISSRRNQIIEYPTMRLHITGQRAVLGMTGGIVGGAGIGWAGWLGWLLGSGEGMLGFIGIDAGTAMGVGMMSAVASIRWAVGRWEKSKSRWWQDLARVGEGLERDLKVKLQTTMERQVVILGETACDGMEKSIRAQEKELADVVARIEEIQAGVDEVLHGSQCKP